MGVITISRGSYSKGKEIAEKLAKRLGYRCVSREILLEASERYNIPEVQLVRAIHDSPSFFQRFTHGKEKYTAFIQEAFLRCIQADRVVYHGLAGHFLAQGVPNILKVRIIANFEDRIKEEMKRENISEKEARYLLHKDDEERRKWSLYLYGINTNDPSLYDIVLHIDRFVVDDAVEMLSGVATLPCFQTTPESQRVLNDKLLAAKAHLALAEEFPKVKVESRDGVLAVRSEKAATLTPEASARIKDLLTDVEGIKKVEMPSGTPNT